MVLQVNQNSTAPPSAALPDGTAAFPLNAVVSGVVSTAPTPLPAGATALTGSSGVVAAAGSAVATLTSAAAQTAYITGFSVVGLGATGASMAAITISGLLGGSINFGYPVPVGATVAGQPLVVPLPSPLPASAVATNIVVTVATLGAGNTAVSAMATGFMTASPAPLPTGATALTGSSGVVGAAGSAVATLTSAASRTAYINGFAIVSLGATGASVAAVTISGLLGGSVNFGYPVPVGVGVAAPPLVFPLPSPLPASAVATNIVVTVATLGSGNTAVAAMATGYMI